MANKNFYVPKYYNLERIDAIQYLKKVPDKSIDLVVTDPAYESLEKHRKIGTTTRLKNKWFPIFKDDDMDELFVELYRVLKNDTHCYVFSNFESSYFMIDAAYQAGFKNWTPLVWDKVTIGMGYHYRSQYELILFFEKGKRRLNDLSIPNILRKKRIRSDFPTQKPVEIMRTLITQSSNIGEIVCDPFFGSCSTGVASLQVGRRFVGCDIWDHAVEVSRLRMRDALAGIS